MRVSKLYPYLTIEGKKIVEVSLLTGKRMSAVRCDDVTSAYESIIRNNEPSCIQQAVGDYFAHLGCGEQSAIVGRRVARH